MTFSNLSQYFEKLEATSKRLELIDILSRLFKESNAEEIGKICYLIQGRVAPFFEPTELGMAESLVAQAIAMAYGPTSPRLRGVKSPKDEVIKLYRQLGNMGLAAEELSKAKRLKTKAISVTGVFNELHKIAKFTGKGTVEQKVTTLANILKSLDPISAKHVVNIPLGTLRLGIGDHTVMDALSLAKIGDKTLRPILEDAYNKTSDLGYVAEMFFKHGEKGLKEVKLVVGKPVRPALAERMPNAEEAVKRLGDTFAAEPKFDGFRVAVHKNGNEIKLFSRNLEDTTHAFPDLVEGAKTQIKAKSCILEGEAIAYNPVTEEFLPFQETTKRRRKYNIEEKAKELPLILFTFDVLYLNGEDVTAKPYKERRKLLESIVSADHSVVRIAEERILHTAGEITKFFNEEISEGLEGLMLKKLDAPYKAGGRGFHWIKFKRSQSGELTDTVDCVLLGVFSGRGKRTAFGVGGLLVGVYDEKNDSFPTISRLGTGLTDVEFREVNEISKKLKVSHKPARVISKIEPGFWVEPKVVMEIFADEITKSPIHTAGEENGVGFALRFPRLVKFRESDKRAEDATTVEEIKKLYEQQYKHKKS
ncbi:MAG: ATP-dependent DNA ligase [Candidatus Curtissbacteria bacterium]|nr:ATP-dependent DNA ligase [Candidatus Curtissbacteria bacterium]